MAVKKNYLTRKIQLYINCDDKELRSNYYKQLFEWQRLCFRGANYIFSHHFLQEQIKDILYITDDIKVKLIDSKADSQGILNTSKMSTTYQILSAYFKGKLPSAIFGSLNKNLISVYNAERDAYWKGEKVLRSYKRNIPIPFPATSINLKMGGNGKYFTLNLFKVPFKTNLGKDHSDKYLLLKKVMLNAVKLYNCALKLDKGKIYMLVSFEVERKSHLLDTSIIAEASLSIEHPIAVWVEGNSLQIGNKEEFLHRRLAIQSAWHRLQRGSTFNRGGNGRKRKLKSLDDYREKEKRYIDSRLHLYSKRLIEFCISNQAGTLLLVNQEQKEEVAKEDGFILRNWSYFGLKQKIIYKARIAGINLIEE